MTTTGNRQYPRTEEFGNFNYVSLLSKNTGKPIQRFCKF